MRIQFLPTVLASGLVIASIACPLGAKVAGQERFGPHPSDMSWAWTADSELWTSAMTAAVTVVQAQPEVEPATFGQRLAFALIGFALGGTVGVLVAEEDAQGAAILMPLATAGAVMAATAQGRGGPRPVGTLAGAVIGGIPLLLAAFAPEGRDDERFYGLLSIPGIPLGAVAGSYFRR